MSGYDDYDAHSTENEPDWTNSLVIAHEQEQDMREPEYQPDEESPESWVGYAMPDGPAEEET